jgi:putative ABC transport system ATP-binding protein
MESLKNLIEIKNAFKVYKTGAIETLALNGVSLQIASQEFTVLAGPSGSGKTTLLNLMGGLDQPTSGEVYFDGHPMHSLKQKELTQIRLNKIGFVFQAYNLIPVLTALENVEYIMLLQKRDAAARRAKALEILEEVGLKDYVYRRPTEMSGGQQQRVAIARAIAHNPKIIFADEPTANLDNVSSQSVMDIFKSLHAQGQTIVMVTHEKEYTVHCDRIIHISDGQVLGV